MAQKVPVVTSEASPEAPTPDGVAIGPEPRVELIAVERAFGDHVVLSNVSLAVNEGEIFGIVGPSGSGKTTLVRMIVGLILPSSGEVLVQGVAPTDFGTKEKGRLGYMPQNFSLYPSLTTLENARFMASLYGIGWLARRKRIREVLEFLELWDARNRLASDLSGGMQRRLSLAGAVLHKPSLMVIDEPTAGLDPVLRLRIWEYLRELRAQGITIIITTQYIEEAERCDNVAIISEGRVSALGTPYELRRQANMPDAVNFQIDSGDPGGAIDALHRLPGVRELRWDGSSHLNLYVDDMTATLPAAEALLREHGCEVTVLGTRQATFEEVFMYHTGAHTAEARS